MTDDSTETLKGMKPDVFVIHLQRRLDFYMAEQDTFNS